MRTTYKVAVALSIGISTGYVGAQTVRTQGAKPPPAYIIAEVEADPAKQANAVDAKRYAEEAPKSLAAFQARYWVAEMSRPSKATPQRVTSSIPGIDGPNRSHDDNRYRSVPP
jgi:hypothetical protein